MNASDVIATIALIVSLMALFVSFSTRFSDFANARFTHVLGAFFGLVLLVLGVGIFAAALYIFLPRTIGQAQFTFLQYLTCSIPVGIGMVVFMSGFILLSISVERERKATSAQEETKTNKN